MKILSVGVNHAGTSMIRTLLTINPDAEIVAYDQNSNISFLGCGIALWVGGEFEKPEGLFYANKEKLEKMGAKVKMLHKVESIDVKTKTVVVRDLTNNKTFKDTYDKLVFAGGTWPIVPNFPGIDLEGIHISKIFQHAQVIKSKNADESIKNVVVVGAGYIGVELVEAFKKAGKNVTLIDIEKRVVNRYFDSSFTSKMEQNMKNDGINLALGEKVVAFEGENNKVKYVVTDKNKYDADMVIMSIGFKPETKILSDQVDTIKTGAIIVDDKMLTSNKDIYAIGDCVALKHCIMGQANVALATNAIKTGIICALDLANKKINFPGVVGTNAISAFNCHYASTGISEETAKSMNLNVATSQLIDKDRPEFMQSAEDVQIKIVYDPKTLELKGAQIGSWGKANHTEAIFSLALAIQKKLKLTDLALLDFFFLPHYNKPFNYILTSVLNALNIKYA